MEEECDVAPPNTKFVVGLQNSRSHDHVSNGDRVWLNRRLSVQSLSARSSQQPTDGLTGWLKASTVRPCSTTRSKNCSSRHSGRQASKQEKNPTQKDKIKLQVGYYLFSCVFVFGNWGFWPFGNSLSLLLLLLSLSLRLVFLFGEALRALTTSTTVTIVIQFREESCARIVCWVGVCMGMGWRKEGRKLYCQTSVCFFSSSLLCICLYLEPWTNITNNASHKTQDVLQYVYVLELYYVQNWAELACPLMMARRMKANLDGAILPPCTQKQSIKLPIVMKNLFASFDLLCTAWSFFLALLENSYASHQKSLLLLLCHKLWS